ncbi:hypothetical protein [Sinomicrobium weinanense]|uniref:DUF4157 domain-containing protein n=1 Tax=Sinomicrobium weinanense TaxID=2842200 RepID=A0A926JS59_9FLAO|nr:hypothetical protein [Sinomicrobium weinanense]MBC9796396.1 hypothetical protein [Sinomicrobium weinanense]MBU3122603.1 hypothetical protein [Sinomicrobium weinanense]
MKTFIFIFIASMFSVNAVLSQPVVLIKGSKAPGMVMEMVEQFMEHLDIVENIHLTISFTSHVPKNMKGITFCLDSPKPDGYHHIAVWLDIDLSLMQNLVVLAHEMVHVKQYAKEELIMINREWVAWKGKRYKAKVYSRKMPWEVEAFRSDNKLAKKYRTETSGSLPELALNP